MSKIAVVDIETTGFSPVKDFIVEIGIVELDLYTGERKIIYDALVKEFGFAEKHANAWVFQNTDLSFDDVMNAEPLDVDGIQEIFSNYYMTAYNKKFDFNFFRERGLTTNELDCPMILATNICKVPKKRGSGYKWPTVEEAWRYFFPNTPYNELHRGADDAFHEAKIVHELYKRGVFALEDEF